MTEGLLVERYMGALTELREEVGRATGPQMAVKYRLDKREFGHLLGAMVCLGSAESDHAIRLQIFENTFSNSHHSDLCRAIAAAHALHFCDSGSEGGVVREVG